MKEVQINDKTIVELPTDWNEIPEAHRLTVFAAMLEMMSDPNKIHPVMVQYLILRIFTGYKPSKWPKTKIEQDNIDTNLAIISEKIDFAFNVDNGIVTPRTDTFYDNPFPKLFNKCKSPIYFAKDYTVRTNMTARIWCDICDIIALLDDTTNDAERLHLFQRLASELYPGISFGEIKDKITNVHGMALTLWVTGILNYFAEHPIYSMLFSKESSSTSERISLGVGETLLALQKDYPDIEKYNVFVYMDAQIRSLRSYIEHALADKMNFVEIAAKMNIPVSTVTKLSQQ